MDAFSLKEQTVLITGASSGIGMACAIECARRGANTIICGRDQIRLDDVLTILKDNSETSQQHYSFSLDFINGFENLKLILDEVILKTGKVSGFVHAAGFERTLPLNAMNEDIYSLLFKVNVITAFEFSKLLSKKKYYTDSGASFVFISSITSIIGRPALSGYSATKGALVSGARSLAIELAPKSIRINCISPGTILTPLMENFLSSLTEEDRKKRIDGFPLGIGHPEDVANTAIFLLSKASKWITGQNIVVDGGYTSQ